MFLSHTMSNPMNKMADATINKNMHYNLVRCTRLNYLRLSAFRVVLFCLTGKNNLTHDIAMGNRHKLRMAHLLRYFKGTILYAP